MMMTNLAMNDDDRLGFVGLGQEKREDMAAEFFFSFQITNEQTTGEGVNEEAETNTFISGRHFINKEVAKDKAKHLGVEVLAAKIEILIREGGQTMAKTRDIAGQMVADDEDEHEHGETIMSNDDDLLKRRTKEREQMFVWLSWLWIKVVDFF